ncbi:proliferation marker protein Ki-67 isoform X2 [Aotus nancymaae]|uniref:proliferation marker protein Ki-67 isoform X2 n=1 Tax=Aotus nancymaae TaxID=37293 RepID=UPI000625CE61|nr:proliferation marker protein Ki-67 isoform X2 [Aotus nancymaae]
MGPTRRIVTIKRSGVDGPHFPLSLSTCLFGRGIECDIRIQLPVVSKQHCKIEINEQEAILHNFSSTNPTQVNGSVIDEPVQLKHGDIITIIDRCFRYENESLQNRSKSTEFPRKIHGQEPARCVSRSSFSSNPNGKAPDSKACSKITEGKVSGSSQVHIKTVEDSTTDDSEGSVAQETPDVHSSEHAGRNGRNAAHRISGNFREISRVKLMSHCGELKSLSTTQCLDDSQKNESPFRKLYQSMKEELDVKSQKENVPQYRRKTGLQTDYITEKESADGLQQETQLLVSCKSRLKSGGSSHAVAEPASPERELSQAKGKGRDVESVQTPSKAVGASFPLYEPAQMKTPEQYPQQQNSPQKHKKDLYTIGRRESGNLGKNEGFKAGDKTLTPRKLSARNRTPAKVEVAADSAAKPGNLSSKTRGSIPTDVEVPPTETEIQNDPFLTLWLTEVERKIQKDSLHKPEKVGATTGQVCPELPGLSAGDISNFGDSLNKSEGIPLKRRRVSFGGHLRPELFDENLPPNTPLKRGETPTKRKSLVVHTPPVLKKVIKEQPQPSGEQQSPSEIHLEVMAQSLVTSPPAPSPRKTPVANDRRSCQAAPASSSKSQTEISKRGGRKSGNLPSKRVSLRRSQHGILQMICSKRRSGASEANLIVAKSWADVVKLGAKQTQTKVVKHGPQRSVIKRQRRPATPKKPVGDVHSQFSTGHANSPCTIIIGKAHTEKVHVPAQPYRMLNNFISNQKRDFKEDLSGIAEMFKTPVKEQPQLTSTCHIAISNSENLLGKKVQVTNSGEEPLLPTSESFGGNAFFSAPNAAKELSDSCFVSPTLTRPSIRENGNTAKTPRNTYKITSVEMKTSDTETEPSKTVSSANKLRRSTELRNVQKLPTESKSEETNTGVVDRIMGSCQKTTPLQRKRGGEMKEIERPFDTCKENIELKENVEKMKAVKRSRRTWGQKGQRVSDLTDLKSLPDTERTKDMAYGQELLQTQDHTKVPESKKDKITKMPYKSLQPEPIDTPIRMKQRPKTSLGKVDVKGELLAVSNLTRTPGEITYTHTEPAGDGKSIRTFKESPKQILNPVAYVTGMKRWPRTPKEEAQSLEDLAGFKELFQTPGHTEESMTDDKTTNIPSKSPPPESVDTPTSTKQRPKRSFRKADVEEFSALRKLTPSAGKATHTPKPAAGDEKDMKALMGTPVQKLDLPENLIRSKRRPQTPKEKAQALEDLTGFKELFQTPGHTEEAVAAGKTTKMPHKSSPPESADTPRSTRRRPKTPLGERDLEKELLAVKRLIQTSGETAHTDKAPGGEDTGIKAFKETAKQKLDPAASVTGSKKQPRTPKRKAQSLEDLTGLKELFQTPVCTDKPTTDENTTKIVCKSPQSDPVDTPTSFQAQSKRSFRKAGVEEFSALRKRTSSSGKAMHTPKPAAGDEKDMKALMGTPVQKLDLVGNLPGSKRQPQTPEEKAQALEDLSGIKELFWTPGHTEESVAAGKTTKIRCKSPQPDPVDTPKSTKQRLKRSLRKADIEEEFLALRKLTPSAGKATHTPKPAVGEEKDINTFVGTPVQKLDLPENLIGSKRRPQTPKEKAQALEDLTGFKELFQTPGHTEEAVAAGKTTKMPHKSSPPESADTPRSTRRRPKTPLGERDLEKELLAVKRLIQTSGETAHTDKAPGGEDTGIKAFKETAKQKLDPAASVTGSKKQPRTPKRKAQSLEDLTGLKELFQTPVCTDKPTTDENTTKIVCKSPQSDPVDTPTSFQAQSKRSFRKAGVEEFSALRKRTSSSGKAMHTPKPAAGDEKDMKALMGTPVQKLDLPENLTGSKRRPQTPKEKAQALEDLAGLKELFQTPGHTEVSMTNEKTARIVCKSSQPDPDKTPTSSKRWLRTSLGKVGEKEELLAVGKLTQMPVGTTHTHTEPTGDGKSIRAFKESPKQISDPAASLTGCKRQPKNSKEKAEVPEDLVGFKELFQTPGHTKESMTNEITMKILYSSSPPDPVDTPTSSKPQPKRSLRKADVEEFLAFRKLMPSAGKATHTPKPAGSEDKDINALMRTPVQKLDLPGNLPGSRRRPQTPKEKAQALEDLTGFKELFQTPCTDNPTTDEKTTKIPCKSPQPSPVDTPKSTKQRPKRSLRKADIEEEFSALGKLTPLVGKVMHTPKPAVGEEKDNTFVGTPVQKLDLPGSLPGSKRRPQTPKERAQAHALEELAGFREVFQTPDHTEESTTTDKITKVSCKSPQPHPVKTATSSKRRLKTSLGKASVKEEVLAVGKLTQTSGETTHTHTEPAHDGKSIRAFKKSAKQMLDSADYVTGMKRWPRTPKEEAQSLEDLAGFKELFQTPGHTKESKTDDKTTNIPSKSSPPESVDTPTSTRRQPRTPLGKRNVVEELSSVKRLTQIPGGTTHTDKAPEGEDTGIKAFKEIAKQKLDLAASVTGSKRQLRNPKRKAESLEDLTGSKELFQTTVCTNKPRTNEKTTKIACKSPQPDPVDTPSFQAQPKRSLRKADIEEEFLTLGKTSEGKAMHTPKPAAGAEQDIKALMGTPVQKLDLPGNLPGSKRRPQTPKEKAQALEDLAGFNELFQTPGTDKPTTDEKTTKIHCKSPQPDPVDTPTSTIQRPKRSVRKAEVEEEFSALRKLMPSVGKAMHTPKSAVSDKKDMNTFVETPVPKLDLSGNLPGSKRRPQTPKEKAEALEVLAGFKELFQTPDHTEESMTDDKITGVSCKSPQPEPFKTSRSSRQQLKVSLVKVGLKEGLLTVGKLTRMSGKTAQTHREPTGGGKTIEAFKESPKQIVDPAATITGSKRQLRTRKEKAHILEDPGVFKELVPAPGHTEESMTTEENTKIPCKSPPPEPADTAKNTKRCPRTRLRKEVKEELSAVQKLSQTSGQSAHTHTESASNGEGIKVFKQRAKKTPDPGVEEPSRRRPRAPKAKAQCLEDLAGFKELSETPGHTQESLTTGKAAKIPCKSPPLELVDTRTSTKRHLRTHAQKVVVKEEPSAVGKFIQTSGEMADADKESGKDKGIKASKESAKQTLAPAACVTGSRSRPRAPRENAHALEDLAGFQGPAPGHPKESMTDDKTTTIPCKSLPEPVDTATSSKRRPRTRAQKVAVKEEPLAAGQLTPASGETTHTDKEPAGEGNGVKEFKQPAKRKLDPENVIGSRGRPRAPKEKAQPPGLVSFQELSQTPGHTEELANGADSLTGTPKQTPDSGKPLKISRRVLRAPKVEPVGDQVGTRDPVKSQSKSNSSLPPLPCKRGCGKDGSVTGTKRLRFMPEPEEIVEELPASKKQRVPPRVRAKSPEPLVVMKRSLRTSTKRSEPAEETNSNSMNTNKEEHKLQDSVPENKGMSLRARRQNKTDVEQPTTEVLILAERMKINRNAKKPMKTSQEMDIQSPDDGAQKAIPRCKASENKRCLRSVRQNKSSQPKVAEEREGQKSTEMQNQEGKGEAGSSDSVRLRSRKTKSQSAASTLESESAQRVTRGVKRCAENPKKAEDIVCIKKIRTRSRQDSEDI